METRAKFAVVGAFTLAVLLGAFGFVWWFAGSRGGSDRAAYLVRFQGAVTGLSTGASVLFNGLRVGEVATLDLAQDDPNVVVARIEVQPRTPVKSDTVARLEYQGLTGIASVQLTGGTADAGPLKAEEGRLPVIRAERSDFQNLLETAQRISGRVDTVVARIERLVADNEGVAGRTLRNVEVFSGALADNAPAIAGFLASTTATAERIGRLSIQAEKLAGDLDAFVVKLDANAANRVVANVEQLTSTLAQNREAINGLVADSASLVRRLNGTAERLDTALGTVNDLAKAVDPQRVGRAVENADKFAAALGGNANTVNQAIKDAGEIAAKLNVAANRVDSVLRGAEGLLGSPEAKGTLVEAKSTLEIARAAFIDFGSASRAVREAAGALDKRFADISGALGRFTASGQREVEAIANEGRRTLNEVNRVVRGVEKNPQQFLLGPRGNLPEYRGR